VRPFGSAANGFSTRFSDLDATCFEEPPSGKIASDYIAEVQPLLQQDSSFEVLEVVAAARIPILKLRFQDTLDVDLSFQNLEPLPNTQLLRAYAKLSPLIRYLGILVKLWANSEGVCGAQHGHLSSYSFILMALYFMQVDEYVKMPCFPTWEFNGNKRLPDCASVNWLCPLQLPSLISRFFEFYATSHCWGYEVISPRVGQRLYAKDICYSMLNGRDNSAMIQIEDPFLTTRNLNCVLGPTQQGLLYDKICEAHADLDKGRVPRGFVNAFRMWGKKASMDRPLQVDVKNVQGQNKTNHDNKKSEMQSDGRERNQNGPSANLLPSGNGLEPERMRRGNVDRNNGMNSLSKSRALPITPSAPYAPSPEQLPPTRFSSASAVKVPMVYNEAAVDADIEDGTTWAL
jgi:hypothetical protein